MKNQIAAVSGFHALSEVQQEQHRAKIATRSKAILRQFWIDASTTPAEQVLELEGWADVLETASEGEFRRAWKEYQLKGPRTQAGSLRKPDAGAIYNFVIAGRAKPELIREVEPEAIEAPCSAEEAANILRELGVKTDEWGKVLSFGGGVAAPVDPNAADQPRETHRDTFQKVGSVSA